MIMFANFLLAASRILHIVLMIFVWILIFRVIFSWIRIPSLYQLAVVLFHLTEPVLKPIRKFVPPYRMGGIDVSPMICILIIVFVDSFLVRSMTAYAYQILRGPAYSF
ncbi:MAG: YggT family protein [Candidatus Aminicenantes bacterium]|nr:YggT family protein [Candidatus Aminicenantes bacterium]